MNEGAYEPRLCSEAKCSKCAIRTQAPSLCDLPAGASLGSVHGNKQLVGSGTQGWPQKLLCDAFSHSLSWSPGALRTPDGSFRCSGTGKGASLSPYLPLHRLGETVSEAGRFCPGNLQRRLRYEPSVSNMPSSWGWKS